MCVHKLHDRKRGHVAIEIAHSAFITKSDLILRDHSNRYISGLRPHKKGIFLSINSAEKGKEKFFSGYVKGFIQETISRQHIIVEKTRVRVGSSSEKIM